MPDVLSFTADNVTFTLNLSFANSGDTSGVVTAVTGTVGGDDVTGIDNTYDAPDNKINPSAPYVTSAGLSFDANNVDYNLVSDGSGGYDLFSSQQGSKFEAVTNLTLQVCFVEGTRIATAGGWTPVERLAVGDRVRTASGALRPVKWVGHRALDCAKSDNPSVVLPVRIAAHAFGPDRPLRDLYLSPAHAVCIDMLGEVLAPVSCLMNGSTIRQVAPEKVAYWHVELDSHDILLAENLPAESYLDVGNRGFFLESGLVDLDPRPDARHVASADFCRPFHVHGPVIEAARAQLQARAEALGWRTAPHAGLHLLAGGMRIDSSLSGNVAAFPLPRGDFWLVCETSRPCDVGLNEDRRDLGVAIARLSYGDGASVACDIDLKDPRLSLGFYPAEKDAIRWTGRRAFLPADLFADAAEGSVLKVELATDPLPRWISPSTELARDVA